MQLLVLIYTVHPTNNIYIYICTDIYAVHHANYENKYTTIQYHAIYLNKVSTFWSADVLVCRRFGLSKFDVSACRCFGLSTFWLSTFRFVDVLTRYRVDYLWYVQRVLLTHWGRDEMNNISQTTFSNVFSWMKVFEFRLKYHWSLFPRVQLTIFQHLFR